MDFTKIMIIFEYSKKKDRNNIMGQEKKKLIHIKKSHEGLFTKYCGGNVTEECIRRGKSSPDPDIRKRAVFTANARKWKPGKR